MKKLVFTVTNDLVYDQRMIRICTTLQQAGYEVLLVGRKRRHSVDLITQPFRQKRLFCFFDKGKAFYIEYNFRLLFFLLFQRFHLVCAIDLDTILPCYLASVLKGKKRVYEAHELFTEMKEVVIRPKVYAVWKKIEAFCVPKFKWGYTVNEPIQNILLQQYGVQYEVIRNMPYRQPLENITKEPFILYQGAVNEGRSFETLIPAFQWIEKELWIYGDGNFYEQAVSLVKQHRLKDKVKFKGAVLPSALKQITPKALLGITLFENKGLSNYYSLANRFFDYIQAGVPQLCVNYPVYQQINQQFEVAVLIDDLSPQSIAKAINTILNDPAAWQQLHQNCLKAREVFNWQQEEKKLLQFYKAILQ